LIHLSSFLGRTFDETLNAYNNFGDDKNPDRLFKIIYWLGQISLEDWKELRERNLFLSHSSGKESDITFSGKNGPIRSNRFWWKTIFI
jgi:hypothetical protein